MNSWEDHWKNNAGCVDPRATVHINGKQWQSNEIVITRVETSSSIAGEASTCFVEISYPAINLTKKKIQLESGFAEVKVGAKLEVKLGYSVNDESKLESVFKGFISAFDLELRNEGKVVLTIQGMDAKMWMMVNQKTELKKDKRKYSMVVQEVCRDYSSKLEGQTVDIKGEVEFKRDIYQRNESDYEFLSRISKLTGAAFFINLGKLYFISPSTNKSPKFKITPNRALHNLKLSTSVWGIPKSVEVVSIDSQDYENTISAQATSSDDIGDGKSAPSLTNNISKENKIMIIDNTVRSVNEASFLAEAVYNQRELNFVEVTLETVGYPEAKLGTGVSLDDFGNPIDNDYIIAGIKHYCDFDNTKYTTQFLLKANRMTPQKKRLI